MSNALKLPPKYSITIVIISNNRLESLQRLCNSVLSADYSGNSIELDIRFSLEAKSSSKVLDYVFNFDWPHGKKMIFRRMLHGGLIRAVSESWFPSSFSEYGLFLEDDIEVSPFYLKWATMTLNQYAKGMRFYDYRLVGISLYVPKVTETKVRQYLNISALTKELVGDEWSPFLMQTPCSWGAIYFPEKWTEFLKYMQSRLEMSRSVLIPQSRTNGWRGSWKKFFFELMWMKGYYMLYPNFPGEESFSTNHLEIGEHIKSVDEVNMRRAAFTVPLKINWTETEMKSMMNKLHSTTSFPLLDLFGLPVIDVTTMLDYINFISKNITVKSSDNTRRVLRENEILHSNEMLEVRNGRTRFIASLEYCNFIISMYRYPSSVRNIIWSTDLARTHGLNDRECFEMTLTLDSYGSLSLRNYTTLNKKNHGLKPLWWSVNGQKSIQYEASLESNGNFVVSRKSSSSDKKEILWQSFSGQSGLGLSTKCKTKANYGKVRDHRCSVFPKGFQSQTQNLRDGKLITLLVSFKDRFDHLEQLIQYYASSKVVSTILVVWHDVNLTPPPSARLGHVMVHFLKQSVDSLNNRFIPSVQIPTDAVLVIDDDIKVDLADLYILLRVWRRKPDHLVGFIPRWYDNVFTKDKVELKYLTSSQDPPSNAPKDKKPKEGYGLMLTKIMLLHRDNLYRYTCGDKSVTGKIHEMVDKYMNCEDLGMNLVMALYHVTKDYAPPMFVRPLHMISDFGKANSSGLHLRTSHSDRRTDCLNTINNIYRDKTHLNLPIQKIVAETKKISESEVSIEFVKYIDQRENFIVDCMKITKTGKCSWSYDLKNHSNFYKLKWIN